MKTTKTINTDINKDHLGGIPVKPSIQEQEFDKYINLWIDGKIPYDLLLEKYPDTNSSLIRKVYNKVTKRMNVKLT